MMKIQRILELRPSHCRKKKFTENSMGGQRWEEARNKRLKKTTIETLVKVCIISKMNHPPCLRSPFLRNFAYLFSALSLYKL
jgi:hypothetical protein